MTELMVTGRASSFMIRNTSFTKQVHFYICKIQIKPKLYPLSRNRNTLFISLLSQSRYSLSSPRAYEVEPFPYGQLQTAELQSIVKFAENCSRFNLPVNAKELLFIYEQVRRNSERSLKWKLCPLYLSETSIPVILLRPGVLASVAEGSVQDVQSYLYLWLR